MKSEFTQSTIYESLSLCKGNHIPLCPGKNQAQFVCLNSNCKLSNDKDNLKNIIQQNQSQIQNENEKKTQIKHFNQFICNDHSCQNCYYPPNLTQNYQKSSVKYLSTHPKCFKGDFQSIVACIQEKKKQSLPLKTYINQLFDTFIDYLSEIKDDYIQKLDYYGISLNEKFFLQCIKNQKFQLISSKLCLDLVKSLDHCTEVNSVMARQKLKQYWQTQQKMVKNIFQFMPKIIFKEYLSSVLTSTINSKIIIKPQQISDIVNMIESQFKDKTVRSVDLLYRASENQFNTEIFHTKCDLKPNTLIFIETQFGKKIGGFTPIAWNKTKNNLTDKDPSNVSFLFSLTNNHKFTLKPGHEAAILHYASAGPTFGTGPSDIYMKNKANTTNIYGNIGNSYINPEYTFGDQSSWTKFSGAVSGKEFKVKQWEVFEVKFQQKI